MDAGLKSVSFSVDKFHQEFVPIETVSSAMRICEEFGVFSSATLMDQSDMSSAPAAIRALRSELYGKDIVIYPVFPVGAAGSLPEDSIIRECKATKAICPFDTGLTVMFDGSVRICCSQFSDNIPMTFLGSFDGISVSEAIAAFHSNDFLYVLIKKQFAWFVERAKELGLTAEKYSTSCELCHELFTNEEFTRRLTPIVKEEVFKLRLEKMFG